MSTNSGNRSVRRVAVTGWVNPAQLRTEMFGDADWQVWLDAGVDTGVEVGGNVDTGHSYMGVGRTRAVTASVRTGTVTERILSNGLSRTIDTTIFDFLRDDLSSLTDSHHAQSPGFQLGWAGWFGYELGAQTVGAPVTFTDSETIPDACLVFLDRIVEFDHATRVIYAISFSDDLEWASAVQSAISDVESQRAIPADPDAREMSAVPTGAAKHRLSQSTYENLIGNCLDEIRAGNAYQLCLTNRIDVRFDSEPNPFEIYDRLRLANPTHHGGMIVSDGVSLLSASPEVFLTVDVDGLITTKPIKGTRPRGTNAASDAALSRQLAESDKERAENLMIVDLMRNDIGRISEVGSVAAEKLLDVESYASVHQLVSTITGKLLPKLTAVDALEACFPAGSMTGAPKLAAMRILNALERGPRGIYSGAFGYVSLNGSCDLAMVIRSIVLQGSHATLGTGGGITSGSIASDEWDETVLKAKHLLRALGLST